MNRLYMSWWRGTVLNTVFHELELNRELIRADGPWMNIGLRYLRFAEWDRVLKMRIGRA